MDPGLKQEILSILDDASDMTIATVREDGYPQATTVSYVNNGLNIYFGCAANSQKAKNIARDSKVSLTVNLPYTSWNDIRGLSIGGRAERITNPQEVAQASQLMFESRGSNAIWIYSSRPVICFLNQVWPGSKLRCSPKIFSSA